jgi:tetratricopeptide (TPR) repeat protein
MDRLIVDVDAGGVMSVATFLAGGELPTVVDSGRMMSPLSDAALEDLRWYLEDYLRAPYGVWADRGADIERQLAGWGQSMFTSVFGVGPGRDAYVGLRSRTNSREGLEIVVRSASPGWLGLPWELMADPTRPTPLALDGVSLSRGLPTAPIGASFDVEGDRLRVLMVISRPKGGADVGYQMIARHLVRRLQLISGNVELVVLRPPSVDALESTLCTAREAGNPFQVVHFDGHGVLTGGRAGVPDSYGYPSDDGGMLVFEKPGGGEDAVPAERIGQILANAQVPVVVLNACQSGAVGKQLEATVATRLLAGGASAVVAMAYSVYAVAAAEFMTAFYERLFAGATVTDAVRAGRARMAHRPARPSPKGKLPLQDWLIPVHYMRKEVRFPHLLREAPDARPAGVSLTEALDRLSAEKSDNTLSPSGNDDALRPANEFVGRDGLFYTLEVAARTQHVIVLHGPGGAGKTEFAKAFGRWWQYTHGVERSDWVLWYSFEPGVASFGLDGVLDTIGLRVWGTDFARVEPAHRRPLIEELLQRHRLLLILDNFETAHSMPDPTNATSPLDHAGRTELRAFLDSVAADSNSTVLLTSRNPELWLGKRLRRIPVGGLTPEEANTYADQLLAPYPAAAPRRVHRAYADLLDWMGGHPLSMRLTLPHLERVNPDRILADLQGIGTGAGSEEPESGVGRTSSLSASIAYSLTHLDAADQDVLHLVSLLHGVADADVLAVCCGSEHISQRFENIDSRRWKALLDRATDFGLLTALGAGMHAIHPALPAHLAEKWHRNHPHTYDSEYAASQHALLDAFAEVAGRLLKRVHSGDAGKTYTLIGLQRRNLGHFLGYALDHQHWQQAQAIIQALREYWGRSGLRDEAEAWTDRALDILETPGGAPPALDQPAGVLWLLFIGDRAAGQLRAGRLDAAHTTYTRMVDLLQQLPNAPETTHHLATTYHQLGEVAHSRGKLDEAEGWYRQAVTIRLELPKRPGLADTYHRLGWLAHSRGKLDEAEGWYRQALTIRQERRYRPGLANSYHQLGWLAHSRGNLEDAEGWYHQALAIRREHGDRPGLSTSYHQLGLLAQRRGNLEDAEDWYRQAVIVMRELGDRHNLTNTYLQLGGVSYLRGRLEDADSWYRESLSIAQDRKDRRGLAGAYHRLGMVAQRRGKLEDADEWYRQALTIRQEVGDPAGLAMTYGQLGALAEVRGDSAGALEWTVRCVSVFGEFPHPVTDPAPEYLARLVVQLGIPALERAWMHVTGTALPQHVREFVQIPDSPPRPY